MAAAHHQQQGAFAGGYPGRQGGGLQEGPPHGGAGDDRLAAPQLASGLGQAQGHLAAEAPQQPGHPAGYGVGFMQNHGNPAPAGRQDRRGGDVAAGAEHQIHAFAADQAAHLAGGGEQAQQLPQFFQAPALEAAGPDRVQGIAAGHQLPFQPVRHPQPVDRPVGWQGLGDGQGGEQVAPGSAGGDQEPGHGHLQRCLAPEPGGPNLKAGPCARSCPRSARSCQR